MPESGPYPVVPEGPVDKQHLSSNLVLYDVAEHKDRVRAYSHVSGGGENDGAASLGSRHVGFNLPREVTIGS